MGPHLTVTRRQSPLFHTLHHAVSQGGDRPWNTLKKKRNSLRMRDKHGLTLEPTLEPGSGHLAAPDFHPPPATHR